MTTPAAAALYLNMHLSEWVGKGYEVYNPHNKPLEELPVIYGFNNGGAPEWLQAVAIAQDGHVLGSHICSHEGYMPHDLGMVKGSRPDRHENDYQKHYPDGYRMDFVPFKDVEGHEALKKAFVLNELLEDEHKENTDETA
jgi:hypothetical protein